MGACCQPFSRPARRRSSSKGMLVARYVLMRRSTRAGHEGARESQLCFLVSSLVKEAAGVFILMRADRRGDVSRLAAVVA